MASEVRKVSGSEGWAQGGKNEATERKKGPREGKKGDGEDGRDQGDK